MTLIDRIETDVSCSVLCTLCSVFRVLCSVFRVPSLNVKPET